VEIDYVQVATLDVDAIVSGKVAEPEKSLNIVKEKHAAAVDINLAKEMHEGFVNQLRNCNSKYI
jgi:hypothetical protein